ncbi:MAG: hypothetical protein AAF228_03505 [Pseudomonadota bacterium]
MQEIQKRKKLKFTDDKPWVQTASGHVFYFGDNDQLVYIQDIATGLAKICRFAGATTSFYSVAQHSILVAEIVLINTKDYKKAFYALLHDAHEAFVGDITMPAKCAINNAIGWDVIAAITEQADEAIFRSFGLKYPIDEATTNAIKQADRMALATERRDVLIETNDNWGDLPPPYRRVIKPWPWTVAEEKFLEKFAELNAMSNTRKLVN